MADHQDPEAVAGKTLDIIRHVLNLVPEAKIMVLVDHPSVSGDGPAGLFSQIGYDRAVSLLRSAQAATQAAHESSLETIARAMTGQSHG